MHVLFLYKGTPPPMHSLSDSLPHPPSNHSPTHPPTHLLTQFTFQARFLGSFKASVMDTDKREQNRFIFTGAVLFNYLFEILSFK